MGLGPHGAHSYLAAPLGGGVQVKDSTPRVVLERRGSSYSNSYSPLRFGNKGRSSGRNPSPSPNSAKGGAGRP
jgi:hypothetical protein